MAYTEFYAQTTGSNLNAGSTTADAAVYTGVGDSDGTNIWTPSDGSTPASTVSVGHFGSVYVTAGATVAVFVGRITAVAAGVNGAITFSTTAKSGTFPAASAGAHTITCKTGGAWAGPNAAVGFPFNFITNALTDATGNAPYVNFKNGVNYAITAAISDALNGPRGFGGYTTTVRDGGRFILDGGTSGTSYTLLALTGSEVSFRDAILQNNGATGSATGANLSIADGLVHNVVINSVRGSGLQTGGPCEYIEVEVYSANQSNTANKGGVDCIGTTMMRRCTIHDNTGSNTRGILCASASIAVFVDSIIDTSGYAGCEAKTNNCQFYFLNCDFYNNGADGFLNSGTSTASHFILENCNFVLNGGYGINNSSKSLLYIRNCGFGSGTKANTSGTSSIATGSVGAEENSVTYASGVTPWVDPANGDFRINLAATINAGRGAFTETQASYTGTVGYPDIGAAQHLEATAGGVTVPTLTFGQHGALVG